MPDAKTLASFYSSGADAYKRLWAPELITLSRRFLDGLPLDTARLVLDAGTGVGTLLPEIQQRAPNATVIGIDVADGMLALGPRRFPLAVMDASRLAFKQGIYDVGVFAFVLFHLPGPLTGLEEMAWALKPGGTVGTITWGDDPSYPAYDIWSEELDRLGAAPALASISRHDLVDTPSKVETLLDQAGFVSPRFRLTVYENRMTAEEFVAHRVGHGVSRHRFESLPREGRAECLGRVRARLERLDPEGFVDRSEVIYAVAQKPES